MKKPSKIKFGEKVGKKNPSMGKIPTLKAKTDKLGKVDNKTLNTIGKSV
jgi:hypothetical protein